MRFLEAIKSSQVERTIKRDGRISAFFKAEAPIDLVYDDYWLIRHEATVRFETRGPLDALKEMTRSATRAIAYEVYGEVEDDLKQLKHLLWEEDYRPPGDPVMDKLNEILDKLRP